METYKLTKDQQKALKRIFDRDPLCLYDRMPHSEEWFRGKGLRHFKPMSYLQFRRLANYSFALDGCLMLPWEGMWLGIEKDGYTHS